MKKLQDYKEFNEAKDKHLDLQLQLKDARDLYSKKLSRINELANEPKTDKLTLEAQMVLSGEDISTMSNEMKKARESASEIHHRVAVLTKAVNMQERIVEGIRCKISNEIAKEAKPKHIQNVKAICNALILLDKEAEAEQALRESLYDNDIAYASHIRAMPVKGIGFTRDPYSYISQYLLECEEYGFISKTDLPEHLQEYVKQKPKPSLDVKVTRPGLLPDSETGWLGAV